ncbi:MAG: hypothetical protein MK066_08230 [Crocinitomicaceae bacterium]|nr:hypothetical protein [Crocinitomicaceae bacterium]
MKKITFLVLLPIFAACESTTQPIEPQVSEVIKDTIVSVLEDDSNLPMDKKYNDLAQFLAGNSSTDGSGLKLLESEESWKSYQLEIEKLWKKTNAKLPVIKDWASSELSEVNADGGTLFYPFSGPDFLHADLFFAEYDHIVMNALEPIGTFPDMIEVKKDSALPMYMDNLKASMNAILNLSFFRTIAMADDFQSELDGTLPVLMHFMARTGHEVLYQERVGVMPDGTLSTELETLPDSTYIGNRYYFKRIGNQKVRTLTYFAVNLQNMAYVSRGGLVAKGLDTRGDFVAYLKGLDIKSTYLKSASYLMHRPTFSMIRDIILDDSDYVLEDDSGIPIEYFDEEKWELTFYGNYSFPISLFEERHQEDLKDVYQGEGIKNLPFGIGYQFHKGTSNLMLAKKR